MKSADQIIQIKISEIVEDDSIYPRAAVDGIHVSHLVEAFRAKIEVPYIVIERRNRRLIDGFHRKRALTTVLGAEASITAISRHYDSKKAMYADAMLLNSGHGQNLTSYDRSQAVQKALLLKMEPAEIAAALRMSVDKVTELTRKIISPSMVRSGNPFGIHREERSGAMLAIPLKMPVRHMAGQELTSAQVASMPAYGGNHQLFYINQILRLIETGMIDRENPGVEAGLQKLRHALGEIGV